MLKCIAPIITIILLGSIALENADRQRAPKGVEIYHAHVRDALKQIPYAVGEWVGIDKEINQDALRILDANSTLSRVFRNVSTGETATLLLVQCADARSLLGHYPPVCYPSQGWTRKMSLPRTIQVLDGSFEATEYVFEYDLMQRSTPLEVLHFTVLPDGRIAPDMTLLDISARDRRFTFFGGASVQFVVDAGMTEEDRMEAYKVLYQAARPWIESVKSGIVP